MKSEVNRKRAELPGSTSSDQQHEIQAGALALVM